MHSVEALNLRGIRVLALKFLPPCKHHFIEHLRHDGFPCTGKVQVFFLSVGIHICVALLSFQRPIGSLTWSLYFPLLACKVEVHVLELVSFHNPKNSSAGSCDVSPTGELPLLASSEHSSVLLLRLYRSPLHVSPYLVFHALHSLLKRFFLLSQEL